MVAAQVFIAFELFPRPKSGPVRIVARRKQDVPASASFLWKGFRETLIFNSIHVRIITSFT